MKGIDGPQRNSCPLLVLLAEDELLSETSPKSLVGQVTDLSIRMSEQDISVCSGVDILILCVPGGQLDKVSLDLRLALSVDLGVKLCQFVDILVMRDWSHPSENETALVRVPRQRLGTKAA